MSPRFYLFLLTFCISLAGCQMPADPAIASDQDYFPLRTGQYIIYNVQESQYSLSAEPIQRSYQLKEVIGTSYTDLSGQTAYRLLRYRRTTANLPWQADSVWSARLVNQEAIRTENGLNFVRLVFPLSNGLHWNGNRYNSAGNDTYEVRNADQPFRVLDNVFDETVTVVAQDDSTLVSQEKRMVVYARQIGLIYKEQTAFQFCTATPACIGKTQIDYGTRQVYRIQTYGQE